MISLKFGRELRLLAPDDFKSVFKQPYCVSITEFSLLARPNNLEHPRLGLAVAKKFVKQAHDRNRIRRLLRESFRLQQHNLPHYDFVFVARKGIQQLDNVALYNALDKLWRRHIILAQKS